MGQASNRKWMKRALGYSRAKLSNIYRKTKLASYFERIYK